MYPLTNTDLDQLLLSKTEIQDIVGFAQGHIIRRKSDHPDSELSKQPWLFESQTCAIEDGREGCACGSQVSYYP